MAWKQDLAKLKQQLGPEPPSAPKLPARPAPTPGGPPPLAEEDAVFLSAMGLKPAPRPPLPAASESGSEPAALIQPPAPETFQDALKELKGLKPMAKSLAERPAARVPEPQAPKALPTIAAAPPPETPEPSVPPPAPASLRAPLVPTPELHPVPETFEEALKGLKGLKPMAKGLAERPTAPAPEAQAPDARLRIPETMPLAPPPVEVAPPDPLPVPEAQAPPSMPLRFQLAAGMALEVDGSLDLRGHSLPDAMERLKDRLGDGLVLGWRSLQVTLGTDPSLHEGLLTLLASGQVPMVTRFAQAPVPMGGNQAWLLYFGPPPAHS